MPLMSVSLLWPTSHSVLECCLKCDLVSHNHWVCCLLCCTTLAITPVYCWCVGVFFPSAWAHHVRYLSPGDSSLARSWSLVIVRELFRELLWLGWLHAKRECSAQLQFK